jgi:CheY-like chemotaxis protein
MRSVLIVDDEPSILFILRMMLEEAGFKVEEAASAREGMQKLDEHEFDAVVTDIRMETTTAGFEVVRAAKKLAKPPIVIISTAFPMLPQVWREVGADELMIKGTDTRTVPELLESLLGRRSAADLR